MIAFCFGATVLLCVIVWIVDRVLGQLQHERLAARTVKCAQQCPRGSPARKQLMAIARYHAHKTGFKNGFTMDELQ